MVGTTNNPIQIDEARFAGRRKYNRGRMLNGDNAPLSEDNDAEHENNRNHERYFWVSTIAKRIYNQSRDSLTARDRRQRWIKPSEKLRKNIVV
ncbi:hypothetical protein E2C01_025651 [Portunus trituberculatus]|uniref:Uncharacterized protein n=1 Tax=Portunus trituberculatus TaxID=210409 RepID=A0A5B7EDV0_PORTR|nr:hypothetical protein [Portunus trituberculatus]